MPPVKGQAMLDEVNVTTARSTIGPVFDKAVRGKKPTIIRRGRQERGVLLDRSLVMLALSNCEFHVNVVPESTGGFTLWLNELDLGGSGEDLLEARQELLTQVRFYVRDYLDDIALNLRIPESASRLPHVLRLSLAVSDRELIEMLFGVEEGDAAA